MVIFCLTNSVVDLVNINILFLLSTYRMDLFTNVVLKKKRNSIRKHITTLSVVLRFRLILSHTKFPNSNLFCVFVWFEFGNFFSESVLFCVWINQLVSSPSFLPLSSHFSTLLSSLHLSLYPPSFLYPLPLFFFVLRPLLLSSLACLCFPLSLFLVGGPLLPPFAVIFPRLLFYDHCTCRKFVLLLIFLVLLEGALVSATNGIIENLQCECLATPHVLTSCLRHRQHVACCIPCMQCL